MAVLTIKKFIMKKRKILKTKLAEICEQMTNHWFAIAEETEYIDTVVRDKTNIRFAKGNITDDMPLGCFEFYMNATNNDLHVFIHLMGAAISNEIIKYLKLEQIGKPLSNGTVIKWNSDDYGRELTGTIDSSVVENGKFGSSICYDVICTETIKASNKHSVKPDMITEIIATGQPIN